MSMGELLNIAAVVLILAAVVSLCRAAFGTSQAALAVPAANAAAMLLMAAGFGVRWKYYIETMNAGWLLAFPVSTFYESASFFLLALLAAFFFTTCLKRRLGGPGRLTPGTARGEALAWCAVDFLASIGILALSLTGISSDPVLFLPSLRSYWLMAHVCLSFVAYGMFALAAILAVLVLCRAENREENAARIRALVRAATVGRFWAWDPKETWAFIAWCCYLALIHFDRNEQLSQRGLAVFAIVNFLVVIFTFVGVNILFAGLHSYALIRPQP